MFSTRCYMFLRKCIGVMLHVGVLLLNQTIIVVKKNSVVHSVTGLHCTWLVPCTRASSNDVDGLLTLRVDLLEEGRSTWRVWPNWYLSGHCIMLCSGTTTLGRARRGLKLRLCLAGIDYETPERDSDDLVLGSGPCPWSLTVALHVSLNLGVEAVVMCLHSLRLPSCSRNPHINLGWSWAQQAAEVLGREFLDQISPLVM
ncbi:hypothetical protein M9H77_19098 [Catharanthus roseus]|uniref:Uncharacterized protein n=1 Tax=Catharanthus roseus TaxID=4058 RepID=A0ACC0B9A6_CATRO|nr:hypothetical protein M9H77_19098 [Catharanthus roseus]